MCATRSGISLSEFNVHVHELVTKLLTEKQRDENVSGDVAYRDGEAYPNQHTVLCIPLV